MRFKKTLIGIVSIAALAGIGKGAYWGVSEIGRYISSRVESVEDVTGDNIADITAYLYDGDDAKRFLFVAKGAGFVRAIGEEKDGIKFFSGEDGKIYFPVGNGMYKPSSSKVPTQKEIDIWPTIEHGDFTGDNIPDLMVFPSKKHSKRARKLFIGGTGGFEETVENTHRGNSYFIPTNGNGAYFLNVKGVYERANSQ